MTLAVGLLTPSIGYLLNSTKRSINYVPSEPSNCSKWLGKESYLRNLGTQSPYSFENQAVQSSWLTALIWNIFVALLPVFRLLWCHGR